MPNFYSLINTTFIESRTDANLHDFVAIVEDILSSHDKSQIHVHNHARIEYSRKENLCMSILIRTPPKSTAYFSVFPHQENVHARVCDMENIYTMPMHLFLINGSEPGEPMLLCNLVRVSLLFNSKF